MILVDLSQVMVSTIMAQLNGKQADIDEELLRHMVLNTIRMNRTKFKEEYGEIVICCDSGNVWRKDVFPYYKARRKTERDASQLNWNQFFEAMNKIRDELRDFFPYKVIKVDKAEADDIIAVLVKEYHPQEKIMILSGDKDFQQLQQYRNVFQYNPVLKKQLRCNDPEAFLLEHILKGDAGDGVPNVLSKDAVFVDNVRQTPMTAKRMALFTSGEPSKVMDPETYRNYMRNANLIDFAGIPEYISTKVLEQFNNPDGATDRTQLFNYFIAHKLKNLMDTLGEF